MFQKRLNRGINRLNNEVLNQLPPLQNYDNGKVLTAYNGKWVASSPHAFPSEFITHFTNNISDLQARVSVYRVGKMVTIKVQNWDGSVVEESTVLFDYLPKPKDLTIQSDVIPVFNKGVAMSLIGYVELGVVTYDGTDVGKVSLLVKNDPSTNGSFSFEFSYFTD